MAFLLKQQHVHIVHTPPLTNTHSFTTNTPVITKHITPTNPLPHSPYKYSKEDPHHHCHHHHHHYSLALQHLSARQSKEHTITKAPNCCTDRAEPPLASLDSHVLALYLKRQRVSHNGRIHTRVHSHC